MSGDVVAAIDAALADQHRAFAAAFATVRDGVLKARGASPDEFALMPPQSEEAPGE